MLSAGSLQGHRIVELTCNPENAKIETERSERTGEVGMKRSGWVHSWRSLRGAACLLAVAGACSAAFPQQALSAVVQAYVVFEIGGSSDRSATVEKLRSKGLGNCLQVIVGQHQGDVFVHIACDERGGREDRRFFNQALTDLSGIERIVRTTLVSLKNDPS